MELNLKLRRWESADCLDNKPSTILLNMIAERLSTRQLILYQIKHSVVMYVCMDGCVYVCMHVCMYVCMCHS